MNTATLRAALVAAGFLGLIAVVRLAAWPLAQVSLPTPADSVVTRSEAGVVPKIAADSAALIVSRDPFRIGRRPALPAYDPLRVADQLAAPPSPPRPALVLVGVLHGNPPSAVIEGLPGVEGARVVRPGDVIAGLAIKQLGGGRVTIAGMDTTWVLQVREPWKP